MALAKIMTKMPRISFILLFLLTISSVSKAEIFLNGRPLSSIENEKILEAQIESNETFKKQLQEIKESNSLLRIDIKQRQKTIDLLNEQINELKKSNDIKQKEVDSHKYDSFKTLFWILVTIILTRDSFGDKILKRKQVIS